MTANFLRSLKLEFVERVGFNVKDLAKFITFISGQQNGINLVGCFNVPLASFWRASVALISGNYQLGF